MFNKTKDNISNIINIMNIIGKDRLIEIIKLIKIKDISKIIDINKELKNNNVAAGLIEFTCITCFALLVFFMVDFTVAI